mmetsp:Transcript_25062/g.61813  ORF Transcript_25062/g.61813 Transcript_25062/m.61813 type:complete len:225 (-) Transcript_25062:129-803(-)
MTAIWRERSGRLIVAAPTVRVDLFPTMENDGNTSVGIEHQWDKIKNHFVNQLPAQADLLLPDLVEAMLNDDTCFLADGAGALARQMRGRLTREASERDAKARKMEEDKVTRLREELEEATKLLQVNSEQRAAVAAEAASAAGSGGGGVQRLPHRQGGSQRKPGLSAAAMAAATLVMAAATAVTRRNSSFAEEEEKAKAKAKVKAEAKMEAGALPVVAETFEEQE